MNFEEFHMTTLGFLPLQPSASFPSQWIEFYSEVIEAFNPASKENEGFQFREAISRVPYKPELIEAISSLRTEEVWHLYTFFVLAVQRYVWACGTGSFLDTIPKQLGLPLVSCAKILEMPPMISYHTMVLWNWTVINENEPLTLGNVKILYNMPTAKLQDSNEGFVKIHIVLEAQGAKLMPKMIEAKEAIKTRDVGKIKSILQEFSQVMIEMRATLLRMYEVCKVEDFWAFRLYLAGTDEQTFFPKGLMIEGTEFSIKEKGVSGAQSPLHQALYIFLSVNLTDDRKDFFESKKKGIYPMHLKFLEKLSEKPHLKPFVEELQNDELTKCFNDALSELNKYRKVHYKIVYDYVLSNLKKEQHQEQNKEQSLQKETENPYPKNVLGECGTGGSKPHIFLQNLIKDIDKTKVTPSGKCEHENQVCQAPALLKRRGNKGIFAAISILLLAIFFSRSISHVSL